MLALINALTLAPTSSAFSLDFWEKYQTHITVALVTCAVTLALVGLFWLFWGKGGTVSLPKKNKDDKK